MNYQYRRRPKRRITGRFYAFLSVLVVLLVMVGVYINARQSAPVGAYQPVKVADAGILPTPTPAPAVEPTAPPANPVAVAESQGADPGAAMAESENEPTPEASGGNDGGLAVGEDEAIAEVAEADKIEMGDSAGELAARTNLPGEWRNILLLGTDSRDMKKIARCDAIMIVSVNTSNGDVKMASLMRDMMIEIPGKGMHKIAEVTSYGKGEDGPKLLMKVINQNLGMNITEYALVNFAGMSRIIDILGGVYINLTKEEMEVVNKHIGEIAKADSDISKEEYLAQRDNLRLGTYGPDTLMNGYAAVTYARIRELDSDYARTQRQRDVIQSMASRVKQAGIVQLAQIATSCWGEIHTNINMMSAIGLATSVLKSGLDVDNIKDWRMPGKNSFKSETRKGVSALYDIDYGYNTRMLHKFIYGEEFD